MKRPKLMSPNSRHFAIQLVIDRKIVTVLSHAKIVVLKHIIKLCVVLRNLRTKKKNLVPRIQNSRFLLTSDNITTPKLYVSPIFFPSSPHFHSLHVTRIFCVKRPQIYFDLFHSRQVGPYLRTWVLKTDRLITKG